MVKIRTKVDINRLAREFAKAGKQVLKNSLERKMLKLGFSEVPKEEILKFILDNNKIKPKRATAENAIQRQFRYVSKTGYAVYIHTGMIGERFSNRGSAWVMVVNQTKKGGKTIETRIITREFYKKDGFLLLEKLTAYAHFFKNICDLRIQNNQGVFMDLCEDETGWKVWQKGKEDKIFYAHPFMGNLTNDHKKIVRTKEISRLRYLKKTEGLVRRERSFRSQWK